MTDRDQIIIDATHEYYKQLEGFTIIGAHHVHDYTKHETWTTLICERTRQNGDTEKIYVEIGEQGTDSRPGILRGLPNNMPQR